MQPRVGWDAPPVPRHAPAPAAQMNSAPPLSPIQASPTNSRHRRAGSESYYEDVDPRFAAPDESSMVGAPIPTTLTPGPQIPTVRHPTPDRLNFGQDHEGPTLQRDGSYENIEGALSPAMSDTSNFTSVSQRGVNPNWRPPPGYGPGSATGAPQQRRNEQNDMILGQNPDFMLPGMRGPSRGGRGRGGMPRPNPTGLTPPGRYPSAM